MARQDIHADPINGDLNTTDNLTNKAIYDFVLLAEMERMDNDNFCYGEIIILPEFEKNYTEKNGVHFRIPYLPVFKQLVIRFRIDNGTGQNEFLINKTDNKVWFPVYTGIQNDKQTIRLSEYYELNEKGNFNLIIKEGYLLLYSGDETDFYIKAAKRQNEVFLLKAFAGNIYQHPTTGVGLIEFLHGNFENSGLAEKLQSEFHNDKMVINNAFMDSITGELFLEVEEKNG